MSFFNLFNEALFNEAFGDAIKAFKNNTKVEYNNANNQFTLTTSIDGVSLTTVTNPTNGNVTFKASIDIIDNDTDAMNNVINVMLTQAAQAVHTDPFDDNEVTVEITINGKTYKFYADVDAGNVVFDTTNENGESGYMYSSPSDKNPIKEWYFSTTSDVPEFNNSITQEELESHGFDVNYDVANPRDECVCDDACCACARDMNNNDMDTYAKFMCDVMCSDCDNDTCDGCDVVGQFNERALPSTVDDIDIAKYIKMVNNLDNVMYVNESDMINNLRTVLINGEYDIEDGYVVVNLEDIIKTESYDKDVEVACSILNHEVEGLERFIDNAVDTFGFSSGAYVTNPVFVNLIDLRFYLPE